MTSGSPRANGGSQTTDAAKRARTASSASTYSKWLQPQHQNLLRASSIAPKVAAARGYISAVDKSQVTGAGFSRRVADMVPGLMLPVFDAGGHQRFTEFRPDVPDVDRDGKTTTKYLRPAKSRNVLNTHPFVTPDQLENPARLLIFTEGARKADSAISVGLDAIALLGVYGWKGTNDQGGRTALGEFHDIALDGRQVVIAFDNDVMTNPAVTTALREFRRYLGSKRARVQFVLFPGDTDGKVGLDDYLAGHTVDDFMSLITDKMPEPPVGERAIIDLDLNEDGNALKFVERHGEHFTYVPERGKWMRWDDRRWRWDVAGEARERVREIAREIEPVSKESANFRRHALSASGVTNTLRLAASDIDVVALLATVNADPYALNTPSGVVDLITGSLRPISSKELVSKSTFAAMGDARKAQQWQRFLKETFGGDTDLITYVQRLMGHSLVGAVSEHIMPFAHGAGANGKSVLMRAAMTVLGIGDDGYAIQAPADFLMAKTMNVHPTELARLKGARLVVCQEINAGQRFDEAKVKQLTGGDILAGRFMRQDYFTFVPTHHLWLVGNHRPEVRDGGPAFWRRVRLIPFDHVVPKGKRDSHLAERLIEEEGPHILAWLVDGAVDALAHGIPEPESVIEATKDYEVEEDAIGRYVEERCKIGRPGSQGFTVAVAAMRTDYENWCRGELLDPISPKAFSQRLRDKGVLRSRTGTTRLYDGIRLKVEAER